MAYVLLIAGWLVALISMIVLVAETIRARGAKKPAQPKAPKAPKRRLWPWRRRVEDEPVSPVIDPPAAAEADGDFTVRPWIRPAGVIAFLLWEAFWIMEIVERSSNGPALQLPYVFLLGVMVGVPVVVYYLSRKWLAADAEEV
jgi:hypothetical protein